jgi:hypothetical protein
MKNIIKKVIEKLHELCMKDRADRKVSYYNGR